MDGALHEAFKAAYRAGVTVIVATGPNSASLGA